MSLLHLPVELVDLIFHRVLPADLVALSRLCSSIYPVAQRLLYRHLSISSRNVGAIITLAKMPHLAHHVRSFAVRLDLSTFFKSFYHRLATALSNMTEVVSLELFVDPGASWVLLGTRHSVFPRLQHLACSFPLDSHVVEFLSNAEALLELEVDGISSPRTFPIPTLPVKSLPRLCGFKGSSHAATAIIPGRPVESIHLSSGDLTQDDITLLAQSTAHVAILGATTNSLPVPLLQSLTHHLPHLIYLRIMTTYIFSEGPDVVRLSYGHYSHNVLRQFSQTFYQNIADALTSLPNLRAFELSGMPWGSSLKTTENERRVWQSLPLINNFGATSETSLDEDLPSDFYLA
jgi:F-box-like